MYNWLFASLGKKYATVFIVIWYLLLISLIILFSTHPDGRFKYLEW
jgi:hypothetical protein